MITRRRRFLVLLLVLAALVPGAAEALYAPHAGVVSANPADNTPNTDGGVFAFGDASFLGAPADKGLKSPVVAFLARR